MQLKFGSFNLGKGGRLKIEDLESGEVQTFSQEQLSAWGGLSARFRSKHLRITLEPGPADPEGASYQVERILVGERRNPSSTRTPPGGEERLGSEESQCGPNDDRVASNDARVGRIMPVGCTGWIVGDNTFLTAGHCVGPNMTMLEFNVPLSNANTTTNPSAVRDQYPIVQNSIVSNDDGPGQTGDDWAVFRVAANTQTGLLPRVAQGAQFTLSNILNPTQVTVVGYGTDTGTANQTQQTHAGQFLGLTVTGPNDATMEYSVDTEGGNSGSPVFAVGGGEAVGIHTNAGCTNPPTSGNTGTSFRHSRLWRTIRRFNGEDSLAGVYYELLN